MKHDLMDTTFLILVKLDSIERLENLISTTEFISKYFNTTVCVLEISSYDSRIVKRLLNKKIVYTNIQDQDPILHRTKYLNIMLSSVNTPYVSIWDADVISTVGQILESLRVLRSGTADLVYPYKNKLLDTSTILRKLYFKKNTVVFLSKNIDKMEEMYPPQPVGGAFFCKLESYVKVGLENEEFYGWGIEDGERYLRWEKSPFTIERIDGPLFHLSHPRGINSGFHHQEQTWLKLRILETTDRDLSNK